MKINLDIRSVAVKQLESAIWMYAYDYDEVAVHTIAGAAFEIYTKRLGLSNFEQEISKHIVEDKRSEFFVLWNKPYNYFKHGAYRHKNLDNLVYDPEIVEYLIYFASEANSVGDEAFRLNCAIVFRTYFLAKHPEVIDEQYYKMYFSEPAKKLGFNPADLTTLDTLKIWLNNGGEGFVNGSKTPHKNIKPK